MMLSAVRHWWMKFRRNTAVCRLNNAGITQDQLAMRMKEEDWDNVITTNLNCGPFIPCSIARHDEGKTWPHH
jgi:NAD(P)-dependent dehydrogenase (short-subunit alcohol dehydrogenase family)